jgi:hypothetical protein
MKRLILSLLILAATVLHAATGNMTVTIDPSGWFVYITTSGFTTGATYNYGMGTHNVPGANTPYITVTSPSYDNTGASGTTTRKVYLVGNNNTSGIIRFPYASVSIAGTYNAGTFQDGETITQGTSGATATLVGAQSSGAKLYAKVVTGTPDNSHVWTGGTSGATFTASATPVTLTVPTSDEKDNGTALVSRIALSEYVFSADTSPAFTAPAGFITNSGGASQTSTAYIGSTANITNSSTVSYSSVKCVANWSREDHMLWGATVQPAVVAFQHFGQGGHPVACVVFTVTDGTHTVTQTVTDMTCDLTQGDAVPVVEYVGNLSTSTLTQGATLTINFKAYPWIGDSNAVIDSSDGAFSQPTIHYAPRTGICDKGGTYGQTVAVVSTSGNDGTGACVDLASFNSGSPPAAYATVNGAALGIKNYNNTNHTRADCGGGIIYVRYDAGAGHAWTGASNTIAGNPATWLTIQNFPGDSTPLFNSTSGNVYIGATTPLLVRGLSFSTTGTTFDGCQYVWFDQGAISSTATATFYQLNCWSVTRSTITTLSQGIRPFSAGYYPRLIRGNTLNAGSNYNFTWIRTCLGNLFNNSKGSDSTYASAGSADPASNCILAYCQYTNFTSLSGNQQTNFLSNAAETSITGAAFVQLVFENKSSTQPMLYVSADSSTNGPVNNVIIWNTTCAGQRWNVGYNDTGTASVVRNYWSVKNNVTEDDNIKSDTFTPTSGNRVGNWALEYGVGYSGNLDAEYIGAPGQFLREFDGLGCYSPSRTANSEPPGSSTNTVGFFAFQNRQAYTGSAGAGNGYYRLWTSSPAWNFQRDWLLPYDIEGRVRGANSEAGAYATQPQLMSF